MNLLMAATSPAIEPAVTPMDAETVIDVVRPAASCLSSSNSLPAGADKTLLMLRLVRKSVGKIILKE